MALVTPSEVINFGKLQLPASQTAAETAARNALLNSLIEANESSLAEQIGYRFDTIPTVAGSVQVTVPAWNTRPMFLELTDRMHTLTSVTNPDGVTDSATWRLVGSGWRVRPLPERRLKPGVWTFTGELGWPELPGAARILLLAWTVDSYDASGSVTQEVNEDGLTTIGFSTSLPIFQQRNYLQSLMK